MKMWMMRIVKTCFTIRTLLWPYRASLSALGCTQRPRWRGSLWHRMNTLSKDNKRKHIYTKHTLPHGYLQVDTFSGFHLATFTRKKFIRCVQVCTLLVQTHLLTQDETQNCTPFFLVFAYNNASSKNIMTLGGILILLFKLNIQHPDHNIIAFSN